MYQVLESRTNQFRGVEVRPDALPGDASDFRRRLDDSLRAWGSEGLLAVWLQVPIDRSALIPVAVEAGFTFHHSGDDYLILTHRLVEDAHIPPYATHFIGAGGVVINGQQELLVVRERYSVGGRPPALKLPGGALPPGEHLADSVVREVLEGDGGPNPLRILGVLPPLARLPLRQIRHLLRLPPQPLEQRDHHAVRGAGRVSVDALGGVPGRRKHWCIQQEHRASRPGEYWPGAGLHGRVSQYRRAGILHAVGPHRQFPVAAGRDGGFITVLSDGSLSVPVRNSNIVILRSG